jgi:hypothetical protein
MGLEIATRDSWKTQPMPERQVRLQLDRFFSPEEYRRLYLGLVPQQMEDKWFIYFEGEWLYFHRSWTGVCIYQVRLKAAGGGYQAAEAWVNRHPQQYKSTDDDYDATLLHYLIDWLLLAQDVPFPSPAHTSQDLKPIHRHHVVGYGRANDEST